MLERGQKANLTYYEGEKQKTLRNVQVLKYDDGLLRIGTPIDIEFIPVHSREEWEELQRKQAKPKKSPKTKDMIFNLRSIGFLKVELAE